MYYTFCVIWKNCVSLEKHQIRIVSKTQIFNNLTSAERSEAQCEVGTALRRQACQRHALSDNQRVKGIASLRHATCDRAPVETCHGASLQVSRTHAARLYNATHFHTNVLSLPLIFHQQPDYAHHLHLQYRPLQPRARPRGLRQEVAVDGHRRQ